MKRLLVMLILFWSFCGVALTGTAASADSHRAVEAVLAYIEAQMPWPQGAARIEILSVPPDWSSVKTQAQLKVEAAGNTEFIGDAAFLVRMMEGSRLVRTDTVRTRIEVLIDQVTATRSLQAGHILTEADLHSVQKWVRRISPEGLTTIEDALGKQLTSSVRVGTEIVSRLLREAPLVKKGKMVKVIFDNGPMRIVTSGLPEEDGVAGAIIRVRNLTSNKIIYARVLGDSLVGLEI